MSFVRALTVAGLLMFAGAASAQVVQLPIPRVTAQGHSCGGVRITPTIAGFDQNGNIQASLFASTTCSTGGRGSRPATFTQTYLITWDFFGGYILSWNALPNPDEQASNGVAADAYGNVVQSTGLSPLAPAVTLTINQVPPNPVAVAAHVPAVIGLTEAQAQAAIDAAGLLTSVVNNSTYPAPKGTVFNELPGAGAILPFGSYVTIYVVPLGGGDD
jgi:PASTA domain-containing protein